MKTGAGTGMNKMRRTGTDTICTMGGMYLRHDMKKKILTLFTHLQ